MNSGSTVTLALFRNEHGKKMCYISNLGDSSAVVAEVDNKSNQVVGRQVTVDHNVSNKEEME